jgi:phosphate transport system protein
MSTHLYRAIESLQKQILSLSALVEESLNSAAKCIVAHNHELTRSVIDADPVIDAKEVAIEEECLKILALNQPVASDLRWLIATMKMNNDLERIGDLTVNIAEATDHLALLPRLSPPSCLIQMADKVRSMVRRCLDSLIDLDIESARQICRDDEAVDILHREVFTLVSENRHGDQTHLTQNLYFVEIAHNLERIGDHATNIAEDIVYMSEGDIIRHRFKG